MSETQTKTEQYKVFSEIVQCNNLPEHLEARVIYVAKGLVEGEKLDGCKLVAADGLVWSSGILDDTYGAETIFYQQWKFVVRCVGYANRNLITRRQLRDALTKNIYKLFDD